MAETFAAVEKERDALLRHVQKLQRALSFWHPGVPAGGPEYIANRAGDDATLLFGYEGPFEPNAVDLNWIVFRYESLIFCMHGKRRDQPCSGCNGGFITHQSTQSNTEVE